MSFFHYAIVTIMYFNIEIILILEIVYFIYQYGMNTNKLFLGSGMNIRNQDGSI